MLSHHALFQEPVQKSTGATLQSCLQPYPPLRGSSISSYALEWHWFCEEPLCHFSCAFCPPSCSGECWRWFTAPINNWTYRRTIPFLTSLHVFTQAFLYTMLFPWPMLSRPLRLQAIALLPITSDATSVAHSSSPGSVERSGIQQEIQAIVEGGWRVSAKHPRHSINFWRKHEVATRFHASFAEPWQHPYPIPRKQPGEWNLEGWGLGTEQLTRHAWCSVTTPRALGWVTFKELHNPGYQHATWTKWALRHQQGQWEWVHTKDESPCTNNDGQRSESTSYTLFRVLSLWSFY